MSDDTTKIAIIIHSAVTCALQDFDISIETITGDVELYEGSLIAARTAIAAMPAPTVKPLVWEQSTHQKHEGCVEYAETFTGTYFISYDNDDFTGYYCDFVFLGNCQWFGTGGANSREILSGVHDDDLASIKTAAQLDYDARILSALGDAA